MPNPELEFHSAERTALEMHDWRIARPIRDRRLVTDPDFRGRYNLYHYVGFLTPAEVERNGSQATRLEYASDMVLPKVEKEFEDTARQLRLLPVLMEVCGQPYAARRADKILEGFYTIGEGTFLPPKIKEDYEGNPMNTYWRRLTPSGRVPGMEKFYRNVFSGKLDPKADPADPKHYLDIHLGKSDEINQYAVGEQAELQSSKPKWILLSPLAGGAVAGTIGLLAGPDVAIVLCAPAGGGAGLLVGIHRARRLGADTETLHEARSKVIEEIAKQKNEELPSMPIRAYSRTRPVFEAAHKNRSQADTRNDFISTGNLFDPKNTIAKDDPILQITRTEDGRQNQFVGSTYDTMPKVVRQELEGDHMAAKPGWRQVVAYTAAENTRARVRWEQGDTAITPPLSSTMSLSELGEALEPWFIQAAKALPPKLYGSTREQIILLQFLLPGLGRLLAAKGLETDAAVAKGNFDAEYFAEKDNWGSTGYLVGWEADHHRKMRGILDSTVYANFYTGVEKHIAEIPYTATNGMGRMPAVNEFAATWGLSTIFEWQRQGEDTVELLARRSPRDVIAAFAVGETAKIMEASIRTLEKARDGNHSLFVQNPQDVTLSLQHQIAVKDRMKETLMESLFHNTWLKKLLLGDAERKTVIVQKDGTEKTLTESLFRNAGIKQLLLGDQKQKTVMTQERDKKELEIPYEHRCMGYLGLVLAREWGEPFVKEFTDTLNALRMKNPVWGDKKQQSYDLGFLFALRGLKNEVNTDRGVEASADTLEKFSGSIEDLVLSMSDDVMSVQFFHPALMNDGGALGDNAAKNKESIGHHTVFLQIAPMVMGSERMIKFADRYITILNAKRKTMEAASSLTMFGGQTSAAYAMEQFKGIGEQNICDRLTQLADEAADSTKKQKLHAKAQAVRDTVAGKRSLPDTGVIMDQPEPVKHEKTEPLPDTEQVKSSIFVPPKRRGRRP